MDTPYENFRILDDKENYAYYLHGYQQRSILARPFLDAGLSMCPDCELLLVDVARIEADKQNYDVAAGLLDRVPAAQRRYPGFWVLRSGIEEKQKRFEEALDVLREGRDHVHSAPPLLIAEAGVLEKLKRNREAVALLHKAITLYSFDMDGAWRKIGELERDLGNHLASLDAYRSSVDRAAVPNPQLQPMADAGMAETYRAMGNLDKALEHYARALERATEAPPYSISVFPAMLIKGIKEIAGSAKELKETVEMAERFGRAAGAHPNLVPIHQEHVRLLHAAGLTSRCLAALKQTAGIKALESSDVASLLGIFDGEDDFDRAVEVVTPCLQARTDKGGPSLLNQLGHVLFGRHRFGLAADRYEDAVRLATQHGDVNQQAIAHCNRGVCAENTGDLPEAARRYAKASDLKEDCELYLRNLLDTLCKLKDWQQAAPVAERLLKHDALSAEGVGIYLDCSRARERLEEGLSEVRTAIGNRNKDKQKGLWKKLADEFSKADRAGESIDCYKKEIGLWPEDGKGATLSGVITDLGVACHKTGDLQQAVACFRRALGMMPEKELYLCNLAIILADQENWEESDALFDRLLAHDGLSEAGVRSCLACWKRKNRLPEGLARAEKQIARRSGSGQRRLWFCLGASAASAGLHEQAVHYYNLELAQWEEDSADPKLATTHANLAASYESLNNLPEAESQYLKAIKLSPDKPAFLSNLALFYRKQGEAENVLVNLEEAIASRTQENQRGFWLEMSKFAGMHGRHEKAVAYCEREITLWPVDDKTGNLAQACAFRADLAGMQAEPEVALKWLERSVDVAPDSNFYLLKLGFYHNRLHQWELAAVVMRKWAASEPTCNWFGIGTIMECFTALGRPAEGLALCESLPIFKTDQAEFLYQLASSNRAMGNPDTAREQLRKSLEAKPSINALASLFDLTDSLNLRDELTARAKRDFPDQFLTHWWLSAWHADRGDYEESLREVREMDVVAAKTSGGGRNQRQILHEINLLAHMGRMQEAEDLLAAETNGRLAPKTDLVWLSNGRATVDGAEWRDTALAQLAMIREDYESAIEHSGRAVAAGTNWEYPWDLRFASLIAAGRLDEAEKAVNRFYGVEGFSRNESPDGIARLVDIALLRGDLEGAKIRLAEYEKIAGMNYADLVRRACLAAISGDDEHLPALAKKLECQGPLTRKHLAWCFCMTPGLIDPLLEKLRQTAAPVKPPSP